MDVVTPDEPAARPPVADDEPSADELGDETPGGGTPALDLSPRTGPAGGGGTARTGGSAPRVGSRRGWLWIGALVAVVGLIGFAVSRFLTESVQYYKTVDEAVAQRADFQGRTFRMEGTVEPGTTRPNPDGRGVTFTLVNKGVAVSVNHAGDPPQLFQDCIPVVVEGRWASAAPDAAFASSAIIVAHDENYEQKNSARIEEAKREGATSSECAKKEALGKS